MRCNGQEWTVRTHCRGEIIKIIHAIGWYFPDSLGGTEVYVAGLCRRLNVAGHEVLVAAPLPGLAGTRTYEYEGVPVFRFGTPVKPTRAECQGTIQVRGAEHLHRWLSSERPEWVHFHTFTTGLGVYEMEAAVAAGARVLATNHLASLGFLCQRGTLMRWGEKLCDGLCQPIKCAGCALQMAGLPKRPAQAFALLGSVLGHWPKHVAGRLGTALGMPQLIRGNLVLQDRMLQLVHRFVLLNKWALEAVVANGAPREKLALNYLGLSYADFASKPGPQLQPTRLPVKVGYFGRIVDIKGVLQLAQAFALLPKDLPIQLEFRGPAGDQSLLDRLKAIVNNDPRVTFCPSVEPSEAPLILAGYDVLCIPSVWFENGPTVMIEAHSVGTPVLGTNIGAMPEIIEDGVSGRLVEPGNVADLAGALMHIARDPANTVDRWRRALPPPRTMDDIAADYLKIYEGA